MKLPTRRAAARPTLEARIVSVERGNNSMNGNPSYWLTLDNGQRLRTQSDSSLAYEITNPAYVGSPRWDVPAPLLKLTLSAAGYIETAEVIGK